MKMTNNLQKPKAYYTVVIVAVLLFISGLAYCQEELKYDPIAADLSELFKNNVFVISKWDCKKSEGYAVVNNATMMYIKSWSGSSFGVECKFLINEPQKGITDETVDWWKRYIIRLSSYFLKEVDINQIIETENVIKEKNSTLLIYPDSDFYDSFEIIAKEVNLETTVIIFYLNKN